MKAQQATATLAGETHTAHGRNRQEALDNLDLHLTVCELLAMDPGLRIRSIPPRAALGPCGEGCQLRSLN